MKGYTQINVIYANKLYRRPANQYESDSSMTNKVHDTNLMHLFFVDLKSVADLGGGGVLWVLQHPQLSPW